jgi:hypothetical protein
MERAIHFLCLANSYRRGGRCVAGINLATGEWVRPVHSSNHGALPAEWTQVGHDRHELLPFEVVELILEKPVPISGQPENWLLNEPGSPWKLVEQWSSEQKRSWLATNVSTSDYLLGTPHDKVSDDVVLRHPARPSLEVIVVKDPEFRVTSRPGGTRPQHRVTISRHKATYDLPITDTRFSKIAHEAASWMFCISLTAPNPGIENNHFKVVATARPLVDDLLAYVAPKG